MASQPKTFVSPEQYLEWESRSPTKHEYHDGEIVAMSGSSFEHNLIASSLFGILFEQLKGKQCRVFGSDLRVAIDSQRLISYPDLLVACPPFHFVPNAADTLVNPVLVVEILSNSTRSHDFGFKLRHYREIPSLGGYLFIEQEPVSLEFGVRISSNNWDVKMISDPDAVLELPWIGCRVPLRELYADVGLQVRE